MEMREHPAARPEALDPGEALGDRQMARVRRVAERIEDPNVEASDGRESSPPADR